MPIAAVPRYLGSHFKSASPALRFGMYLELWGLDLRTGKILWKTHDVSYRQTGSERKESCFDDENKTSALNSAAALNDCDRELMAAHAERQQAAFRGASGHAGLRLLATSVAPFTTGLGNEHPLENGFAFLNPYGLPYLPGSGVKGVVRRAAEELAHKDYSRMSDESCEWSLPDVWRLFGFERWPPPPKGAVAQNSWEQWIGGFDVSKAEMEDYLKNVLPPGIETTHLRNHLNEQDDDQQRLRILLKEPTLHARGVFEFWDVVPSIAGARLAVEIMTPHQSHYYQGKPGLGKGSKTPHDSGSPNPISFLTVPPDSEFAFHVRCDPARLKSIAPHLAEEDRWKGLVKAAFEHAFEWLGFGAKTAVGYGAMERDRREEEAARERAEREAARRAEEEKERRRNRSREGRGSSAGGRGSGQESRIRRTAREPTATHRSREASGCSPHEWSSRRESSESTQVRSQSPRRSGCLLV